MAAIASALSCIALSVVVLLVVYSVAETKAFTSTNAALCNPFTGTSTVLSLPGLSGSATTFPIVPLAVPDTISLIAESAAPKEVFTSSDKLASPIVLSAILSPVTALSAIAVVVTALSAILSAVIASSLIFAVVQHYQQFL